MYRIIHHQRSQVVSCEFDGQTEDGDREVRPRVSFGLDGDGEQSQSEYRLLDYHHHSACHISKLSP